MTDHMRKDNALVVAALEAELRGQPPNKRVKTASRDLQEKLYNLCVARRDGNKTVVQVLCGTGYTFSLSRTVFDLFEFLLRLVLVLLVLVLLVLVLPN